MGKTIASVMIMTLAAVLGFFLGTAINSPEMGAVLLVMIAGFGCTIQRALRRLAAQRLALVLWTRHYGHLL